MSLTNVGASLCIILYKKKIKKNNFCLFLPSCKVSYTNSEYIFYVTQVSVKRFYFFSFQSSNHPRQSNYIPVEVG